MVNEYRIPLDISSWRAHYLAIPIVPENLIIILALFMWSPSGSIMLAMSFQLAAVASSGVE